MLYYLIEYLSGEFDLPGEAMFRSLPFRMGVCVILSLIIALLVGDRIIRSLKRMQIGETVRDLGLEGQMQKSGTPTMGGLIILLAILVPCILFARLDNVYIIMLLLTTIWMGSIGFVDDYIKIFKNNKRGLKAKFKLFDQIVLGVIVGLTMLYHQDIVVRLTPEEAKAHGYQVVSHVRVYDQPNPAEFRNMVYCKSSLTDVPFLK